MTGYIYRNSNRETLINGYNQRTGIERQINSQRVGHWKQQNKEIQREQITYMHAHLCIPILPISNTGRRPMNAMPRIASFSDLPNSSQGGLSMPEEHPPAEWNVICVCGQYLSVSSFASVTKKITLAILARESYRLKGVFLLQFLLLYCFSVWLFKLNCLVACKINGLVFSQVCYRLR